MEFKGILSFDFYFWIELLQGLIIAIPALALIFLSCSKSVQFILYIFVINYIVPYYVIKSASTFYIEHNTVIISYIWLVISILFYKFLSYYLLLNKSFYIEYNLKISRKLLVLFPIFIYGSLILWCLYFYVNKHNSGFYSFFFLNNNITVSRFSFYNSSQIIQALYVVFLRFISPLSILFFIKNNQIKNLYFYLILVSIITIQSMERQNFIILISTWLTKSTTSSIHYLIPLMVKIFIM